MIERYQIKYVLFVLILLFAIINAGAAEQDQTAAWQHMNTQVINEYITTMIKEQEPVMKEAVVNDSEIDDFKLNDASFDINNGKLSLDFTVWYKNRDITGTLGFEVRVSNEGSPQIGGYCLGLEGRLSSKQILTNLILTFTSGHLNKRLLGKEFWQDHQKHNQYRVFKNGNLTDIVNQAFIAGNAVKQLPEVNQTVPGGALTVNFKNITCQSFDSSIGQAKISSDISAIIKMDNGRFLDFPNAGAMQADFDFYLNPSNKSWWAKLSRFKLTINLLAPQLNSLVQEIIDKYLVEHQVLIPLDMPKAKEKTNQ